MWKKLINKIVGDNTSLLINMTVLGMLDIFITGLAGSYIAVTLSQWPAFVSIGIGFFAIIMLTLGALQIIQMARVTDQDETQQQILMSLEELGGEVTQLRQRVQ
jgi:uncharacterized paraquat-inducible protein A